MRINLRCAFQAAIGFAAVLQCSSVTALLPHRALVSFRQKHQRGCLGVCRRSEGGVSARVKMDGEVDEKERKQLEARRLQQMAAEAAAAALAAEERSQQVKTGALQVRIREKISK